MTEAIKYNVMGRYLLWCAVLLMFITSNSVLNIECQAQSKSNRANSSNTSYTASKKSEKANNAKVKKTFFESELEKAEKGDSEAMVYIGLCYQHGHHGCTKDIEKSKYWYNKAIQVGNVEGYSYMASIFERDDEKKYIEWLRKGVEKKASYCFVWLHNAYKRGSHGLNCNKSTAGELLLQAGELKLPEAFFYIGLAYKDGGYPNIQKDKNMAIFWFKKALDDEYARRKVINDVYMECLSELGSSYEPAMHVDEYQAWLKEKSEAKPSHSSSTTSNQSLSSQNSSSQSYIYTLSGSGQSQNTGQWTEAGPSMECVVQFFDDHITVNGMYCKYLRTSGAWKVYEGLNFMGNPSYYYVDGNKNMKMVCDFSSAYGFDTFVYPMSRNGDPTPNRSNYNYNNGTNNNGGYSQNNNSNNNNQSVSSHKCAYCNGTGRIERNDNAPASFGQTRANKRCNECGKVYDPTVFTHYHVQCGHCGGTGRTK